MNNHLQLKNIKLTITKQVHELTYVKEEIATFLEVHFISPSVTYRVQLILETIISSIIKHAQKDEKKYNIRVYTSIQGREILLEVLWRGHAYNPLFQKRTQGKELADMEEEEVTVYVARKLAKSVRYIRPHADIENRIEVVIRSGRR